MKSLLIKPIKTPKLTFFPLVCLSLLQKVSEKVGGAEGTKLDDEFTEMEKARLFSPPSLWIKVSVFAHILASPLISALLVSVLPSEGGHHLSGSVGHHDEDHRVPAAKPRSPQSLSVCR